MRSSKISASITGGTSLHHYNVVCVYHHSSAHAILCHSKWSQTEVIDLDYKGRHTPALPDIILIFSFSSSPPTQLSPSGSSSISRYCKLYHTLRESNFLRCLPLGTMSESKLSTTQLDLLEGTTVRYWLSSPFEPTKVSFGKADLIPYVPDIYSQPSFLSILSEPIPNCSKVNSPTKN
jgi:hypothetical protein